MQAAVGKCRVEIKSDTPPAVGVPEALAIDPSLSPMEVNDPMEVPPSVGNWTFVITWAILVGTDSMLVMPTMSVRVLDEKVNGSTHEKDAFESSYAESMLKSVQMPSNK